MGKLLVVDDDELLRECVAEMLTADGYTVVEAKDGLEALMVFQQLRGEVAMVIMDNMMPRMDGIAATRVIKAADPSVKVILMSGNTSETLLEAEIDEFLHKPFGVRDLLAAVQKYLLPDLPQQNPAV